MSVRRYKIIIRNSFLTLYNKVFADIFLRDILNEIYSHRYIKKFI